METKDYNSNDIRPEAKVGSANASNNFSPDLIEDFNDIPSNQDDVDQSTIDPSARPSKKIKSKVWDHLIKIRAENLKDQKAQCKYCNAILGADLAKGTSCLKNHIDRCKKYPANIELAQRKLALQARFSVDEAKGLLLLVLQQLCTRTQSQGLLLLASALGLTVAVGLPCRLVALSLLLQIQLQEDNMCASEELAKVEKLLENEMSLRRAAEVEVNNLKSQMVKLTSLGAGGNAEIIRLHKLLEDETNEKKKLQEEITTLQSQLLHLTFEADQMQRLLDRLGSGNGFSNAHTLMLQGRHSQIKGVDNVLKSSFNSLFEQVGLQKILSMLESQDANIRIHAVKVVANLAAEGCNTYF
ncbi:hypothetical protein Ancab_031970 [Ancistrocladus abbreviatus]